MVLPTTLRFYPNGNLFVISSLSLIFSVVRSLSIAINKFDCEHKLILQQVQLAMAVPNWSPSAPAWFNETFALLDEEPIVKVPDIAIEDFIEMSNKFPIKFPIQTGRCEFLKNHTSQDVLERNINSVYPVIHENALELYCKFILFKRKHGSQIEKDFYKQLTLKGFINRLLTKRAVMFMGRFDQYLLLNGQKGSKNWETIGTDKQKPPLVLQDCLSYDEIKCSVFLSVSSYTYFVNRGDRKNMAKFTDNRSQLQDEGVIIGLIGPRLKKNSVMEYQDIVFTDEQNTKSNGYGSTVSGSLHKLFSDFYEEDCFDFKEVTKHKQSLPANDTRYTSLVPYALFDNHLYYKRLTFSIDTLLIEANNRAEAKGVTAYIHVVGLGLGVWKISDHQEKVYMDAFANRIMVLGPKLNNTSDICFSYINQEKCGNTKHGEIFPITDHPQKGIKIHINKRQPNEKLPEVSNIDKVLVISYAWDGNALPGNEYWSGKLGSSGDSATASSTQIPEIHNPHINPLVSADNLKIVTQNGVLTFEKYIEEVRNSRKRSLEEPS